MTAETERSRQGRRSPTATQLQIWRDFIETAALLQSEFAGRLQSESGLSAGDYAVLLSLSEAQGQRLRSSELATRIDWERSRLSHHLARMERRDLVRREDCATDSRGAEVVLTGEGRDAFRRASAPHLRAIHDIFVEALTPQQLQAAGEIAAALRAGLGHAPARS